MIIRLRTAFFIFLGLITAWFIYAERAILSPFLLAAIFAYIFNPVINFFSNKIKLPRGLSVIIIYLVIVGSIIYVGTLLTTRVIQESSYFGGNIQNLREITRHQINTLPEFVRPYLADLVSSVENLRFTPTASLIEFFPQAFTGIFNFFVFVFAGFYFLKEGRGMFDKILNFVPNDYKLELEILFRKINAVLSEYLRGQLLLIVIMAVFLFIPLEILRVKFALIISIFSGVAELVPLIGPLIAASAAVAAVYFSGTTAYGFSTIQIVLIVLLIYFLTRQIQDYFITPHVMGRIVKLHPLVILFAVIAGGHIGGILGIIVAVPIAAVIKILLEFSLDKINAQG